MKIEINVEDHTFTVQWDDQQCNKYAVPEGWDRSIIVQHIADYFSANYLKHYIGDGPVVRSTGDAGIEAGFNLVGKWNALNITVKRCKDGNYSAFDEGTSWSIYKDKSFTDMRAAIDEHIARKGAGGLQYKSAVDTLLSARGWTFGESDDGISLYNKNGAFVAWGKTLGDAMSGAILRTRT